MGPNGRLALRAVPRGPMGPKHPYGPHGRAHPLGPMGTHGDPKGPMGTDGDPRGLMGLKGLPQRGPQRPQGDFFFFLLLTFLGATA